MRATRPGWWTALWRPNAPDEVTLSDITPDWVWEGLLLLGLLRLVLLLGGGP